MLAAILAELSSLTNVTGTSASASRCQSIHSPASANPSLRFQPTHLTPPTHSRRLHQRHRHLLLPPPPHEAQHQHPPRPQAQPAQQAPPPALRRVLHLRGWRHQHYAHPAQLRQPGACLSFVSPALDRHQRAASLKPRHLQFTDAHRRVPGRLGLRRHRALRRQHFCGRCALQLHRHALLRCAHRPARRQRPHLRGRGQRVPRWLHRGRRRRLRLRRDRACRGLGPRPRAPRLSSLIVGA